MRDYRIRDGTVGEEFARRVSDRGPVAAPPPAPNFALLGGLGWDWATRLGGLMVVPSMLGAMFVVHLAPGFGWSAAPSETHPASGNEFVSVLLALGLFFLFRGNAIMGPHTHVRRDAVERRESTPPPAPTPPTAPTPRA